MKSVPRYVACPCQHCSGKIEFDSNELGDEQNTTVPCPHCRLETIIFVPPVISATGTKNSRKEKSNITIFTVVIGLLCIAVLFFFDSTIAVCLIPVFAVVVFVVSPVSSGNCAIFYTSSSYQNYDNGRKQCESWAQSSIAS